ncbi:MAG: hypothetical protein U1E78_09710 [Gammaproteobacteria bacterium]
MFCPVQRHKVHDCDEDREGNNPENSAVKGIYTLKCVDTSTAHTPF